MRTSAAVHAWSCLERLSHGKFNREMVYAAFDCVVPAGCRCRRKILCFFCRCRLAVMIGTVWSTPLGLRRVNTDCPEDGLIFYIFNQELYHGALKGAKLEAIPPYYI